jgi:hypothetical protein
LRLLQPFQEPEEVVGLAHFEQLASQVAQFGGRDRGSTNSIILPRRLR